jgi:hypothetical protein
MPPFPDQESKHGIIPKNSLPRRSILRPGSVVFPAVFPLPAAMPLRHLQVADIRAGF